MNGTKVQKYFWNVCQLSKNGVFISTKSANTICHLPRFGQNMSESLPYGGPSALARVRSFIGAKVMFSSFCWKSELMLSPLSSDHDHHHWSSWSTLTVLECWPLQSPHPPKVEANPPLWTDTTSLMRPLHLKIYITHHFASHHCTIYIE